MTTVDIPFGAEMPLGVKPIFDPGTKVTFLNDYGVSFPGRTVIGMRHDPTFGLVYDITPTDTPWFPARAKNLFLESPH